MSSTIIGGLVNDEHNFPSLSASTKAVNKRRDQLALSVPLPENENVEAVDGNNKMTGVSSFFRGNWD